MLQEVYCCHYVQNFTQHLTLFWILLSLVLFFECFLATPVVILILTFDGPDSFQSLHFLSNLLFFQPLLFPLFFIKINPNFIAILGDAVKLMFKGLFNASVDMTQGIKLAKLK